MPTPFQYAGVADRLARWGNLLGRLRLSLADEILPTVQVADHSAMSPPPLRRIATSQINQAAVAGELATFALAVPPGVVCVLRSLWLAGATAQRFIFEINAGLSTAGMTQIPDPSFMDERLDAGSERPAMAIFRGTQVAGLSAATYAHFFGTSPVQVLRPDWIIGTGRTTTTGQLAFQATTANELVRCGLIWDEYQIQVPQAS